MSFSGAMTALETHLTAAGTAVTPTITDIRRGWPPLTPTRCIAYWYAGDGAPAIMPQQTLNDWHVGEKVVIAAYWPMATLNADPAERLDIAIQATNREIQKRLHADQTLGEECAGLEVGESTVEPVEMDGQLVARLLIPVTLDFTDIEPLAR